MLKRRTSPLHRACLLAIGLSAMGAAHAAPLASGSATLSDIRYELIDLRPDDGVTPWIRFGGPDATPLTGRLDAAGQTDLSDVGRQASWEGLLPTQAVSVSSSDGLSHANATANSLGTSFQVGSDILQRVPTVDDGSGRGRLEVFSQVSTGNGIASLAYGVDDETGQVSAVDGQTGWQPYDFTLSPHTAIVVRANASASLTLDAAAGAWDIRNPGGPSDEEPMIGSGVQIALMLVKPDFQMQQSYGSTDAFYADMDQAFELTFDGLSADWTADAIATMTPSSRDLMLSLDNVSDKATQGSLTMTGMSQFAVWRPAPAVPEPGTWALMGLGFAALSWRARRMSATR
jgi:hypothetical protein